MPDIIIRTQEEFDALPALFEEQTRIIIQNGPSLGRIVIREVPRNASIEVYDNASVAAYDNASVAAYDNASVEAYDNASIWAYDNVSVWAYENASVEAHHQTAIRRYSNTSKVILRDHAVCWDMTSTTTKILSFAEFSKHTNPVIASSAAATTATAAKLTSDQKNELLAQFKSFLESR
jgi:hypothetical protein